jgi:hypothetical protein
MLIQSFPTIITGTCTGLRISAVNGGAVASGGAFLDACDATILKYCDGNHWIELRDASGRILRGVLKAAGGVETLGTAVWADTMLSNGTAAWSLDGGTLAFDTDHYLRAGVQGFYRGSTTITSGKLYKSTIKAKDGTSAAKNINVGWYAGLSWRWSANILTTGSFVETSKYQTAIETSASSAVGAQIADIGAGDIQLQGYSIAPVLTPSATGVTIVSDIAGVTYNFSYKDPSFTYNAASYDYRIMARRRVGAIGSWLC